MDREAWATDPRQDLEADSREWSWLLGQACDADFDEPLGLFGALHFLRCMGCRLEPADRGYRLTRGDCPQEDYEVVKAISLLPQSSRLRQLLKWVPPRDSLWFPDRAGRER